MCYDGAFEEPKQISFADSEATEPAPVSYYGVGSQESEVTRDESSDIAEEVHKSLLVEKNVFSLLSTEPDMETEKRVQGEEG